jgi:nucleotide-binding universal stress UspA family protein
MLVGLDESNDSPEAVRLAAIEARLRGRPLDLVSVFSLVPSDLPVGDTWWPRDEARRRMMRANAIVNRMPAGIEFDSRLVPGRLADILIERSSRAECVFIGPTARHATGDPTAAERVAAHSAAPVCVVPVHAARPGGPIIVGVAGTEGADPLLAVAFAEAERRGVAVLGVYVWTAFPNTALGTLDPFDYRPAAAAAEADRVLAEALAGWQEKFPDVEVHRRALCGPDAERGLAAFTRDASMVVVAPTSEPGRRAQLLGPVTRGLLHDAHCPVLVVPTR